MIPIYKTSPIWAFLLLLTSLSWAVERPATRQELLDPTRLSIEQLLQIEVVSITNATSIPEALRLAPGVEVARIDADKWAIGVRGFTSRLSRALLNLVHNAIEAMPKGGTLTLRGRRDATMVQLDVSDTGSGIPPEQCARIFGPLYTNKPGGTGLEHRSGIL